MSVLKQTIKKKRAGIVEKIAELKAQLSFIDGLLKTASKKKQGDEKPLVKKKTEEEAPWKLIYKIRTVMEKHNDKWMGAKEISQLMVKEGLVENPSPAFESTISGTLVRERDDHSWILSRNNGKRACVYHWREN